MAEKELEAFLRFGNQRTSLLLMYLTSPISFKSMSDCDFFFIGSVASCFLSCKLFAHGELEIIGQAETDESFFFKKTNESVSHIFFQKLKSVGQHTQVSVKSCKIFTIISSVPSASLKQLSC